MVTPETALKNTTTSKELLEVLPSIFVAFQHHIKNVFIITDESGQIISASDSFFSLFGLNSKALHGESVLDFFADSDRSVLANIFTGNVLISTVSMTSEVTGIRRDGATLPLSAIITKNISESTQFYTLILEDRTEHRKEQEKIEKLEHQAAIGTFTSGIAHEFNNLLTGIRGYTQLVKNDLSDMSLVRKAFSIIEQETTRGAELCKNLSLYSGTKRLNLEPVDLIAAITYSIEMQESYFAGQSIHIRTEFAELPSVIADKSRIHQLLSNLITNARHAILAKGFGTIIVRLLSDNDSVIIQIEDDGIGIPAQSIPRIFDPFYSNKFTASQSDTKQSTLRGTGLGLPVCQVIVKQHGGTIDVSSNPESGTIFTIHLPKKFAQVFPSSYDGGHNYPAQDPLPLKVLVVDDEMSIREVIFRALSSLHVDTSLAGTISELKDLILENRFDVIFLDYILPEMNADKILPILKDKFPSARIVMISGWSGSPQKKSQLEKIVD
ncbi:MAG TPA: hybrid sensor histidine kinase/response regulator, partial [Spirochaetota bacterium]